VTLAVNPSFPGHDASFPDTLHTTVAQRPNELQLSNDGSLPDCQTLQILNGQVYF
jgi:hypothetical protein